MDEILKALDDLSRKIEAQGERIGRLETMVNQKKDVSSFETKKESIAFPPKPPMPKVNPINNVFENTNLSSTITPEQKKETMNLEENIGGKWFARIGITALVLGVSFLLKYAFDNNWIGEVGRVIIGIIIGMTLLGLGEKTIRKYFAYGQIITGGGIAILYLSIFAAFDFYHLIGQIPAFFLMTLITASGIILSLRYNAMTLMIVSILGGFLTPILVSDGQNNQIGLLSYVLLLDTAILIVSAFRKWRALNFIGFFGTTILFLSWGEKFYTTEALGVTMFFLTIFFVMYSISSLIYNLLRKEKSSAIEQILTLLSASVYFLASYNLLNGDYHLFMGFFALILAVYYFLWAYFVRAITPEDKNLYNFLAFLTVGFITVAIPIQFEGNFISICWLVEALLLFFIGIKSKEKEVKLLGFAVFILAIVRLFFFDSSYSSGSVLIFNKVFLTFVFAIIVSYIAVCLFKLLPHDEDDKFMPTSQVIAVILILANFMTIFCISREINFYYSEKIEQFSETSAKINISGKNQKTFEDYDYDYDEKYYQGIERMENKNSVTLSIFWLIYSIALLIIGIAGKYKGVRVGGLALLLVAILKLFFYDLWNLGTLYRIISSISLGVVLLMISFAYQKYKDKIKEII